MANGLQIRSVSFDTSFLLKENPLVDQVIRILARDRIPCFLTATVASELEQLKVWGRISKDTFSRATKRWIHTRATVVDFKNRLVSDALGQACQRSMGEHGVPADHVVNDCSILVSTLKNGVDLFLSEDYHFTSAISREVMHEVTSAACQEYHLMCDAQLYSIDTQTFLEAYDRGTIDLDVVYARMKR
ncbi:MAG: hypothetical protein JXA00_06645 [Candidatus Thermoplasmatota archaeon]|nr:hypothetical protein [Candidatus Thermoplasmatota archaeon]